MAETVKYVAWSIVILFVSLMTIFEIMERRYKKRSDAWLARYNHRKSLSHAVVAGEGSLEFHAMQCTNCGGFHREDDDECPAQNQAGDGKR